MLHIPKLHAKVFLLDGTEARVGSANLTMGGMYDNVEIGLQCTEQRDLSGLLKTIKGWQGARTPVSSDQLLAYDVYAKAHFSKIP